MPYDCLSCGACCCNPAHNAEAGFVDYVEVDPRGALFRRTGLLLRYAVQNAQGEWHLRLAPDGSCLALVGTPGVQVRCAVYPVRPPGCRRVEPGDDECRRARAERGVEG